MNDDMVALPGWDEELLKYAKEFVDQRFMLSATMVEPRETGYKCAVVADFGQNAEQWN
jgi:hypothetical protein